MGPKSPYISSSPNAPNCKYTNRSPVCQPAVASDVGQGNHRMTEGVYLLPAGSPARGAGPLASISVTPVALVSDTDPAQRKHSDHPDPSHWSLGLASKRIHVVMPRLLLLALLQWTVLALVSESHCLLSDLQSCGKTSYLLASSLTLEPWYS